MTTTLDLDAIFNPDQRIGKPRKGVENPEQLPPEWYERWQERSAIMEYDGHLPPFEAEVQAFQDVLRQMRQA